MTSFTISLAGVPIRVHALFEKTASFCADYLCDDAPAFEIRITREDIDFERAKSEAEDELEGIPPRRFSDAYLETLAVYRKIAAALLKCDVLLFHGSVVAYEGMAYLFTAPSGTGKTTHSRLWLSEIPGSYLLNGDKPLLHIGKERVWVCGTPWQGKENYGRNEIVPLRAVCILERAAENRIEPISFHDAMPVLLGQSNRPEGAEPMMKTLQLVERLGRLTKLYRLGCNMEPEAALVSFRAMYGGLENE